MMRKMRKMMVLVAMVAICCNMIVPVSTMAATERAIACNHKMHKVILSEYWSEDECDTHDFKMSYESDGQWYEEADHECERTYIHQIYRYRCFCGLMQEPEVHTKQVVHSLDYCPEK